MQAGGRAGAVFNAAKEIALDHFIAGWIGFLDMARVVDEVLDALSRENDFTLPPNGLDDVQDMDARARRMA